LHGQSGSETRIDVSHDVRRAARLQAGDRIITGSVVQVGLEPGDEVIAELGAIDRLRLMNAT
jgi:2-keto-4-pentenoate hydratase/2-oxohepta-3-ene-1,7-dioic acid hydratase in catechol pathway